MSTDIVMHYLLLECALCEDGDRVCYRHNFLVQVLVKFKAAGQQEQTTTSSLPLWELKVSQLERACCSSCPPSLIV